MYAIALTLYVIAVTLALLGLCWAASTPCPPAILPPRNRRGGRLGRWLKFHGSIR